MKHSCSFYIQINSDEDERSLQERKRKLTKLLMTNQGHCEYRRVHLLTHLKGIFAICCHLTSTEKIRLFMFLLI